MQEAAPKAPQGADAFALAYARWYPSLVSYCRHVGCGDDSPEDVAQEAFMRAWSNWDPAAADRSIWPWLAVIAKRCCLDRWRRSARNVARAAHLQRLPRRPPPSPEECVEEAEDRALATWAFMQLRPGERRILGLREIERWTYQDIADMENTSLDAVRASLRRSRAKLREAYRRAAGAVPVAVLAGHGRRLWDHVGLAVARVRRALPLDLTIFERAEVAAFSAAAAVFVAAALPAAPAPHGPTAPPAHVALGAAPAGAAGTAGAGSPKLTTANRTAPTPSPAVPKPAEPRARKPAGSAYTPLPTDPAMTPEQTWFSGFAVADGDNSTVFAYGDSAYCPGTCKSLFESTDGGASWIRLTASHYTGGDILLAPSYPSDPTLFDVGGTGLGVSADSGNSFKPLAPLALNAAVSPGYDAGDQLILLGAQNGWQYRRAGDTAGTLTPLPYTTSVSTSRTFSFAPGYPRDDRIIVGGIQAPGVTTQQAIVSVCDLKGCRHTTQLPGATVTPHVAVAPSYGHTGLVFAWEGSLFYRSLDGGLTFQQLVGPGNVMRLTIGPDDTLYAAVVGQASNGRPIGGVYISHDRGATWTARGQGTTLAQGTVAVAVLGPDRLLAAPAGSSTGFWCSVDDGLTWTRRCPAS